ncbi:ion transporter [Allorhodopirellula solitaria]|uniref:Cyclic nucleotide-gated potassium channel n=1 Tax=Allorhodopirellula solitaria TaxID=2527987 RepID=A0A5C5YFX5_9BACT|nr:ion transporter [Allorhodopirellula solitaria]TWT73958.1 Cyclic nucleotide-gated potassium channel [Allorhodopirellula solitaria]
MDLHRARLTRAVSIGLQGLIIASLLAFALETLPDLSEKQRRWLRWFEVFTVAVFTVEYVARIAMAEKPLRFAFSFFGIVDLLAILPFYLQLGFDLRSLRALRLLRLFRILKLGRYNKAIQRFHRAAVIAHEELVLFLSAAGIVLYLAAVGIYQFENEAQPEAFASVFHSLWWAVCTLTTVGYGDVYPVTNGGKCFTFVILLVGLGIVAVPAGLVASALSQARDME